MWHTSQSQLQLSCPQHRQLTAHLWHPRPSCPRGSDGSCSASHLPPPTASLDSQQSTSFPSRGQRHTGRRQSLRHLRQCRAERAQATQTVHMMEQIKDVQLPKVTPIRIIISGPPAAGKGTQCQRIVEKFGVVHISAGDLLRAEVELGTPEGKQAQSFMDRGNLVPNEIVVSMVKNRLSKQDAQEKGWLLDGYPRSDDQAKAIIEAGIHPDIFIIIEVPDNALVERVSGRRLDPETGEIYHLTNKPPPPEIMHRLTQRSDDTEDKLRTRLDTHHSNVKSVVSYYSDMVAEVDGNRPMDQVWSSIDALLTAHTSVI